MGNILSNIRAKKQDRQTQKLYDNVTKSLQAQSEAQENATSPYPLNDLPLQIDHSIPTAFIAATAPVGAIGKGVAKGLEWIGEKMMPSAFLKGVGQVFPKLAKVTKASPYADAGLLSYWGAQGLRDAKQAAQNGDIPGAIAGASMAALPLMGINPEIAQDVTRTQKANEVARVLNNKPILEGYAGPNETSGNMKRLQDFIEKDVFPRLQKVGHNVKFETTPIPEFRLFDPKTSEMDKILQLKNKAKSEGWFLPWDNTITTHDPIRQTDYGLVVHEAAGHALRHNINPKYVPIQGGRKALDSGLSAANTSGSKYAWTNFNPASELFTPEETKLLIETYEPLFKGGKGEGLLGEYGAVNTQFRGKISQARNHILGEKLDPHLNSFNNGDLTRMLLEQPYTQNGTTQFIAKHTHLTPEYIQNMPRNQLDKLISETDALNNHWSKIKNTMIKVGGIALPVAGIGTASALSSQQPSLKQGGILKAQKGKALKLVSKVKPLTHTNNFSGVENLSKEAIGFGGARPNLGLQIKQTEDRSKELIKIFDAFAKQSSLEARREAFMQERFGKSWNDLSELEQYWTDIKFRDKWK